MSTQMQTQSQATQRDAMQYPELSIWFRSELRTALYCVLHYVASSDLIPILSCLMLFIGLLGSAQVFQQNGTASRCDSLGLLL